MPKIRSNKIPPSRPQQPPKQKKTKAQIDKDHREFYYFRYQSRRHLVSAIKKAKEHCSKANGNVGDVVHKFRNALENLSKTAAKKTSSQFNLDLYISILFVLGVAVLNTLVGVSR